MPEPSRGAFVERDGVRFRVWSSCAERVLLCLHDADGPERQRVEMAALGDGDWEVFVPGCAAGQRYGFRVFGPWRPDRGERCNPNKLLLDPYARLHAGQFRWSAAVFDYTVERVHRGWRHDERDSAPVVPHSVVTTPLPPMPRKAEMRAWHESVVYEANVRGYTMAHPDLDERERGKLRGLSNGRILEHLKALGITTVELMPVHAFIDERHLFDRGLRNLWGYNTIGFFAVAPRLAGPDPVGEFRTMVEALHDAGFEVLLDVVYNHTGESDGLGPTLGFRGLDNLAYYRVEADDPGRYVNETGTGNTVNADHPVVHSLVLDSLRYWHRNMGVDGFRFDLAPILGLREQGFDPAHPLLTAITDDPALQSAHLVAEPWGPGGYQLGRFPGRWAEWNDRYRDRVRRFWNPPANGGAGPHLAQLARRLHGSADLFDKPGRGPGASVNLVTAHDGFTLVDQVSYSRRHNRPNGEDNRDGHSPNHSVNHGVEGPTERRAILALRRRHRLNLLATLLFSQGVPLMLAGDEFGNSQSGNNNAYAQDNATGWVDWSGLAEDPEFFEAVCRLVRARRAHPLLSQAAYVHEGDPHASIDWFHPDGHLMRDADWRSGAAVLSLLKTANGEGERLAILVNGHDREVDFQLPPVTDDADASDTGSWRLVAASSVMPAAPVASPLRLAAWSIALLAT